MFLNCGVGEDESPLDCKEIQPANPKGNQSWIFIGRTDAEVETPILLPVLMQSTDSLEKTLMLGKIEGGRRGNDRKWDGWMASQLNEHESEQALGVGEGQGILTCCSPWDCRVRHNWVVELHQQNPFGMSRALLPPSYFFAHFFCKIFYSPSWQWMPFTD